MWKLLIIAVFCSVGCLDTAWTMPQSRVRAVADDHTKQDAWEQAVIEAISDWDAKLEVRGCATPFVMSDDGHEVRLVLRADWDDDSHVGFEDHDGILIRSALDNGPPLGGTLLHELGHAMGLGHTSSVDGPSIMLPIAAPAIFPRDVEAAAVLLGC